MSDGYEGEIMHWCPMKPFDFKFTCVVVVSGDRFNPCGHMLLCTGHYYFHVAGPHDPPRYMPLHGYERYMRENKKTELRRLHVNVPNPAGAHSKLEELLAKKWLWLGLWNNCLTFCEEILEAGGAKHAKYWLNCPTSRLGRFE